MYVNMIRSIHRVHSEKYRSDLAMEGSCMRSNTLERMG